MNRSLLAERWHGTELMDDPACDEVKLFRTLRQFESINFWVSRYRAILKRWLLRDMKPGKPAHLVDIGAGGCEIAVWLLRESRRRGLDLRVTAIDPDERTAAYAAVRHRGEQGLKVLCSDASALHELGPVDYVFSNHLLHHLEESDIASLLQSVDAVAGRRWVMSDLARSPSAYAAFQVFGRFYRNSFAFEDGCRSIRRSFTPEEMTDILARCGLHGRASVHRLLPGRLIVTGEKRDMAKQG